MAAPIQIVLNADNYHAARDTAGGGPSTDFFAHQDREFELHKRSLNRQLVEVADALDKQPFTNIGCIKVTMRRTAWAKSHRPFDHLFKDKRAKVLGGEDLGELLIGASSVSLREVAIDVLKAENETRLKYNEQRHKEIPHPSGLRSEVGAISHIELYGREDKRRFSIEQAIAWLSQSSTGGFYHIELFDIPPPKNTWDIFSDSTRMLYQSFVEGLENLETGLSVHLLRKHDQGIPALSMRLAKSQAPVALQFNSLPAEKKTSLEVFDDNPRKHERLLNFLENHPLVRSISLPSVVVPSNSPSSTASSKPFSIPTKNSERAYPKIGVIDSGISDVLGDWIIGKWDILDDADTNSSHGTFIGGLAVAGNKLNGTECCAEQDGVELVDLAVFPAVRSAFSDYYPQGIPQFYDEIEVAVADARAKNGVRVFNMSLNVQEPVSTHRYSSHATRLDEIADKHDALVFISTGNLDSADLRAEWPETETDALTILAASRNDGIWMPSESVRNVAVAAVNPPGDSTRIAFAPTRYSRRGPGMRAGSKPDLCHVGGFGSKSGSTGHGLFSISPDGTTIDGCGTSYAAPLVAKTAATLDHMIEGDVSRETLIALLVHHAQMPSPLISKQLRSAARHLVGFGIPPTASEILETDEHEITLVFATRVRPEQKINFDFSWPPSLVDAEGRCKGYAKLTLVSSPPLDSKYGAEFVRVNISAALQQEQIDGTWKGKLDPLYLPNGAEAKIIEAERIQYGLKWSPVKVFEKSMPRGIGKSSSWRLAIEYLTRAGEKMPSDGVPFTAILTISDLKMEKPVFNEMRQMLSTIGVQVADIRTAARITPRV